MTAVVAPGISSRPRLVLIHGGREVAPSRPARSSGGPAVSLAGPGMSPRPGVSPARPGRIEDLRLVPPRPAVSPSRIAAEVARAGGRFVRRWWALILGLSIAGAVILGGWMVVRAMGGVVGGGSLTPSGAPTITAPPAGTAGGAVHPVPGQAWVVQPGDTLWGIVEAAGVRGDPRLAVAQMSAQLGGAPLAPGDTVHVP